MSNKLKVALFAALAAFIAALTGFSPSVAQLQAGCEKISLCSPATVETPAK
jgi:hypothetical protein